MSYFSFRNLKKRIFPSLLAVVELVRVLKSKVSLTILDCLICPYLSTCDKESSVDVPSLLDALLLQSEHLLREMLRVFVLVLIIALILGFLTCLLISRL